ncbi:hypothetical protein WICPIJ_004076 [Wickerhamomyces pijperi]|uniref:Anaphase-promoting complex subunit 13 n=1 Tax=Wickerhamomyces pijperi TaxID=599730 RepID=A0A9P8Q8R8_WICPI|nr:hypothetical protein WICPIJ_004076 [Wickerhamomyces pijperi]
MSRDSHISYVHSTKSHHSLYLANWVRDKLPHDDIELGNFDLDFDHDEELNIPTNVQSLSLAAMKSKRKGGYGNGQWKDLDLQRFLEEDGANSTGEVSGKRKNGLDDARDMTMLKKLDVSTISQSQHTFDKDIFSRIPETPEGNRSPGLFNASSASASGSGSGYPAFEGNLNSANSNNSNGSARFTTPEVVRNRPSRRKFSSSFQTPTTRKIR